MLVSNHTMATLAFAQRAPVLGGAAHMQRRTLFGLFRRTRAAPRAPERAPLLAQDDLFHKFSESPIPAIRARGERIRALAPCPVSMSKYGVRRLVNFECPDCGWPTHFSEAEWAEDSEHGRYVARLREANEDEHDLRSGRPMHEFVLPSVQPTDEAVNMSSWDVFFYTRNFRSINSDRSRRHVSKLLTFPMTVASVIHEHSPYTRSNGRLTHEGLRSLLRAYPLTSPPPNPASPAGIAGAARSRAYIRCWRACRGCVATRGVEPGGVHVPGSAAARYHDWPRGTNSAGGRAERVELAAIL